MHLFNKLSDAKTYVINSGVVDWDWGNTNYSNSEIVEELLPAYIRSNSNSDENFDSLLKSFITEVLGQNPSDYGIN